MRLLRLLTTLLLIVTLPAYAWASLGLSSHCPMEQARGAALADGSDCCDPADPGDSGEGKGSKSQPCKAGQECKAGSLYQPRPERVALPAPAAREIPSAVRHLFVSRDSTGVWRPPRFL